jgi:hypothetical protein
VIGLFLLTSISAGVVVGDRTRGDDGSYGALINVLALPLHIRDLIFLGHIDTNSALHGVDGGGLLATICYLGVLVVGGVVLWWRYRWVER